MATRPKITSIDKLLNDKAKQLKPGESITIPIIKGSTTHSSLDEILNQTETKALQFPRIAKFGESVVKPNFESDLNGGLHNVTLYEQDIPKIKVRKQS